MARKRKESRVAAVSPQEILSRDLKQTAIWIGIATVVVGILVAIQRVL